MAILYRSEYPCRQRYQREPLRVAPTRQFPLLPAVQAGPFAGRFVSSM